MLSNPPQTRKDQILDTAERLFSERGYHATTIREIAHALELEGGSLYSHISGKHELLYQIVLRGSEQFLRAARESIAEGGGARAQLLRFMQRHLAIIAESRPRAIVHFHEWRHLGPQAQADIRARRDEYEAYLRQIIREGVARGEFAAGDERAIGLHVLSLLNWTYQWYQPGGTWNARDLAEQYFELLMRGLAPH
ncbi:MAG TPA: TetR/AcrR family transcriptional regulator [Kouleothrix sp.]|uniref:TetR/AcrR family transcriptional regulator n=1 Tax=Kouleothrix sp. TaxID=2779161 RepID=UPI002CB3E0FD|nr:TetR/AcrR family transcriptional regulator [Kouleothrix sp.]HRC74374.1 TetR/AcrR family transcriptional regulator [Kouleothrix sp.]